MLNPRWQLLFKEIVCSIVRWMYFMLKYVLHIPSIGEPSVKENVAHARRAGWKRPVNSSKIWNCSYRLTLSLCIDLLATLEELGSSNVVITLCVKKRQVILSVRENLNKVRPFYKPSIDRRKWYNFKKSIVFKNPQCNGKQKSVSFAGRRFENLMTSHTKLSLPPF